jgi:hypothetical protein
MTMSNKGRNKRSADEVFKGNVKLRTKDLWPDFAPAEGEVPPLTILKEQASVLGLKLKNLIEADVETGTTDYQRFLRHSLFLIAPVLNFYRYKLLEVEHSATNMYPVTIKQSMDDPASPTLISETTAEDEGEFKDALRSIFASEKTRRVIENLLAQSLAAKVDSPLR